MGQIISECTESIELSNDEQFFVVDLKTIIETSKKHMKTSDEINELNLFLTSIPIGTNSYYQYYWNGLVEQRLYYGQFHKSHMAFIKHFELNMYQNAKLGLNSKQIDYINKLKQTYCQ